MKKKILIIVLGVVIAIVLAIVGFAIYMGIAASQGFYKNKLTDRIWWHKEAGTYGPLEISFDRKKIYNLWSDYPDNMTKEEVEIFDKENPFWADFLKIEKIVNNRQIKTGF